MISGARPRTASAGIEVGDVAADGSRVETSFFEASGVALTFVALAAERSRTTSWSAASWFGVGFHPPSYHDLPNHVYRDLGLRVVLDPVLVP